MKVSVCIATYNGSNYIKDQINSILCQLSDYDEIIISDDNSSDNTIDIIKEFNDDRIILIRNQYKHGATYNFENALKNVKGDYIFLSDQDDIWMPEKLATMIHYLKYFDLVISDCIVVDSDNKVINDSYFALVNSRKGFFKNIVKNSYLGCCMAFNRYVLQKSLPFPRNLVAHDIWIGLISEIYGNVAFIDTKLIFYRRHGSNLSYAAMKSSNSFIYKVKYRVVLIFQIFFKIIKSYFNENYNTYF